MKNLLTKKYTLSLVFILFISLSALAQSNTIGLLKNEANLVEAYTLYSPEQSKSAYLINNCGEKINEWTFTERPGLTLYLLENGNILRAGKDSLEIRDWDNNLVWSYAMSLNGFDQHHDIEPLPNGNILCLLYDYYSKDTIVSLGRDSAITLDNFKLDKIIELQPFGTNNANLVWEWRFIDHFIQDSDPLKPNFGNVSQNPQLLNINVDVDELIDYTHCNGIDYNEDLDQILISARHTSEIYIIDHSTTTLEAAGHSGGNSGLGGDFLWRWGNPKMYDQAGEQKLFFQHDPKWIANGNMDEGKISVFNNGGDGSNAYSSIHIIAPSVNGYLYNKTGNEFLPSNYFWSWNGSFFGRTVLESKKSSCQFLKNGNALICETTLGQISEIDRAGNHLWSYKNPVANNLIYNQNDSNTITNNSMFRAEKYPINFVGFIDKDISSKGIIENENSLTDSCNIILSVGELAENFNVQIKNPIENGVINFFEFQEFSKIKLINLQGQVVFEKENFVGSHLYINQNITPAIYFLMLEQKGEKAFLKVQVL